MVIYIYRHTTVVVYSKIRHDRKQSNPKLEVMPLNLLQMSFSGAAFIAAVTAIRAAAINRLPKKAFPILWELVLARLLIPFSVPSAFSVYTLMAALPRIKTENILPAPPRKPPETMSLLVPASTAAPVSVRQVVWLSGMVLCAVFFLLIYLHCLMEFRASCPVCSDYAKQWLKGHPLKRPLSLRQSDKISAPLTYGIFRPVILMPKGTDWQDTDQLQYILLHEYVHVRSFDTAKKLITILALCVHWFNPFVWIMFVLFNRDMELSCDECVIQKFGETSKSAYARILIEMEEKRSSFAPLCNGFCKNAIEERITAIMKTKKLTVITIILTGFVILGTAGIFATSAAASAGGTETVFNGNQARPNNYAIYEPYGLTVNQGKLYYNDKPVRCFEDQMPAKGFRVIAVGYYEKSGVIDVRAVRETVRGKSRLTGLETLSQEEFESREFAVHSEPVSASQSDNNMFAVYENFGLTYDQPQKALFYKGKRIRLFWDSQSNDSQPSGGEAWFLHSVSNWDASGEIDLYAVRDFGQTDANGYGTLSGLRIASAEEFDANTKIFSNQNSAVETAE